MSDHKENDAFARLIRAMEPWLEDVVIIGGWAHRLYRLHPRAQALDYEPLMTLDTDVAVPARLPAKREDLRQRLIAGGFREERMGEDQPPVTHYHLLEPESGFFAEFLTPLTGSELGRRKERKATKRIAGVVSQQLRFLEILLHVPWIVGLGRRNGFALVRKTKVQIANPVSFLTHKILIHERRRRAESAKDILYIHDTLETFGAQLAELKTEWNRKIKARIPARSIERIERAAKELFREVNDEIRRAVRVAGARSLSPETLRQRCAFGLGQIFQRE